LVIEDGLISVETADEQGEFDNYANQG